MLQHCEYFKSLEKPVSTPNVLKMVTVMQRGFVIWHRLSGTVLSLKYFEFMKAFIIQARELSVQMFQGIEQYV